MGRKKKSGGKGPAKDAAPELGRTRRARWKRTSTGVIPPPSLLDRLTGLPNRYYLEGTLHANLEELRRQGRGFGVLFIDIDGFKEVNDLLGRHGGDKVLRAIGNTLNELTRPFDIVGRAGGEEFLAIVANVSLDALSTVAEKLRRAVEKLEVPMPSDTVRVTVSIGGALAQEEDTKETLIKKAYRLMLRSKTLGRNRVTVESGGADSDIEKVFR